MDLEDRQMSTKLAAAFYLGRAVEQMAWFTTLGPLDDPIQIAGLIQETEGWASLLVVDPNTRDPLSQVAAALALQHRASSDQTQMVTYALNILLQLAGVSEN